jgi:hypothetical protein
MSLSMFTPGRKLGNSRRDYWLCERFEISRQCGKLGGFEGRDKMELVRGFEPGHSCLQTVEQVGIGHPWPNFGIYFRVTAGQHPVARSRAAFAAQTVTQTQLIPI